MPPDQADFMRQVRNRIIGDRDQVTPRKASLSLETREYEGGVAFERSSSAVSLADDNRCYPLSTAYQTTRDMHAPQRGRKTLGEPLDEHAQLVRDILKVRLMIPFWARERTLIALIPGWSRGCNGRIGRRSGWTEEAVRR